MEVAQQATGLGKRHLLRPSDLHNGGVARIRIGARPVRK